MIIRYPQPTKKKLSELKNGDTFIYGHTLCMKVAKYEDFQNYISLTYVSLQGGDIRTMPGTVEVIPCECEINVK